MMNDVTGHMVLLQVAKIGIDPYIGVAVSKSEFDSERLRRDLGLPLKVIRESVTPDLMKNAVCPYFRFCKLCLNRGYHGTAYQFQSVIRCPIHGDLLETQCRTCGKSTAYHLNAFLLNFPFRCGHCLKFYSTTGPRFIHKTTLKKLSRTAITRARILHC
jgi:hypothetical protein